ncbi:ATP-binding protein [Streptomyces sp. NPDC050804]|uniref:ATP-binding protein n=1 Tax=unclassified Streptomyces TaxID=2593676 RepID=UPI003427D688|nr:ATP-binding protein [Streptomyces sp. NBC_00872]
MTTTAVRTPRAVHRRDGEVMNEHIEVAPCRDGGPPRAEDACQVGAIRRIAAARLRHCGLEALTDTVLLLISELLTNAMTHSGTKEIDLHLAVGDGFLSVTVVDGMPGRATPRHANDNAVSGRGLVLVESLVEEAGGSWGTSAGGAETWCTIPLEVPSCPG